MRWSYRTVWRINWRPSQARRRPSCKWSMPGDIVARGISTSVAKQGVTRLIKATCIAESPSFPFVLRPTIHSRSSQVWNWTRRSWATRISRGLFLLGDFLFQFCKHWKGILKPKRSPFSRHEFPSHPVSVSYSFPGFRPVIKLATEL